MDNDKGHIRSNSKMSNHISIKQEENNLEPDVKSIVDLDIQIEIPREQDVIDQNKNFEENLEVDSSEEFEKENEGKNEQLKSPERTSLKRYTVIKENKLNNAFKNQNRISLKKLPGNDNSISDSGDNLLTNRVEIQSRKNENIGSNKQAEIFNLRSNHSNSNIKINSNELPDQEVVEIANLNEVKYSTEKIKNNISQPAPQNQVESEQDNLGKLIVDVDKELLVNENEFEGVANQDLNDPGILKKLEEEMDHLHPRKELKNGQLVKYNPFKTNTGLMCCCEDISKSQLDALGIGIVVYFQILKTFAALFFLIIVFNLPLYYIYPTNHTEFKATDYKDLLFKTTLGNVGSSLENCHKIPVKTFYTQDKYTFSLDCGYYNISSITMFGLTSNYNQTVDNLMNCQNFTTYVNITADPDCSLGEYLNEMVYSKCLNQRECEFEIDTKYIQENCNVYPRYDNFFLTYNCYDNWVYISVVKVERPLFSFIVVAIDVASMLALLITLFVIPLAQESIDEYFKRKIVGINDYTLNFQNMGIPQEKLAEELDSFIKHLNNVYKIENPEDKVEDLIYDINYPLIIDRKLYFILQRNKITQNLKKQQQILTAKAAKYSEKKMSRKLKNIDNLLKKEDQLKQKIFDVNSNELKCVDDIYVTFIHQKYRNRISKSYNKNCCKRLCLIFFCQRKRIQHLYYKDRWLDMQTFTDSPSNILWQNVPYSNMRRYCRKFLAIFLACILIVASFGIVIGTKYAQIAIYKRFNPNIDCNFINYTEDDVISEMTDSTIVERSRVKTYCFCRDTLLSQGITATKQIVVGDDIKPCENWLQLYLYSQGLSVATFIIVPIINIILDILLRILTVAERNKTISIQARSKMWKSFFLQFINTAIVILLVNINITKVKEWRPDFPIFTGLYNDLDPRWYHGVGVTIVFCMIINILSPHIFPILYWLVVKCKRLCDTKCCTKGRKTKQITRRDYYLLYLGPVFDIGTRYSQILVTIFVVLIYSPGMPILYLCCFLFLFVTYWVDKFLLLRFYRSPPNIDLFVAKLFDIMILFGMILHFAFAIWMYGNKTILTSTPIKVLDNLADWIKSIINAQDDTVGREILNRITYSHNIICLIFLCLLILILIWNIFLKGLVNFIFCLRKRFIKKVRDDSIYDAIGVKSLYMNHQLRKAQYFKIKAMPNSHNLIKNYFDKMILVDREKILGRLENLTKKEYNCNIKTFDEVMPQIIKELRVVEQPIIRNNVSYNIAYIPEFRDVVYFELILPYLNKN